MTLLRTGIVSFYLFLTLISVAQNEQDAALWADANLILDLGTGLEGKVQPQIRFDENISRVSGIFTDIGIEKKLNDILDISLEYRVGARRRSDYFEDRHRFSTGISAKKKWGEFGAGLTVRYQLAPNVSGTEGDVDIKNVLRQKAAFKYDGLKRLSLSTSVEVFMDRTDQGLSDWRWQCDIERKLTKRKFVSIGYMIQKNLYDLDKDYVISVSYKYEFKSFGKKRVEEE